MPKHKLTYWPAIGEGYLARITGSGPTQSVVAGNLIFFSATDNVNGNELWKSDGTAAGTVMVKDIWPGGNSGLSNSSLKELVVAGNNVFFRAYDGVNGWELWRSDGTAARTILVKDIYPGSYRRRTGSRWGWGTYTTYSNNSNPGSFSKAGSNVLFRAYNATGGAELWKTDGTSAGTVMVKDIWPGGSSSPQNFGAMGDTVYFTAQDGVNGYELWKSDGTSAGTVMVKNIYPGSGGSYPRQFAAIGNTIYFDAADNVNGYELWKSDGTTAGTVMVKDIASGYSSSQPRSLTALGNTLYFTANDGVNGNELWKSDGTAGGTVMVKDLFSGGGSSSPQELGVYGNKLYFGANNGISGRELWVYDGTPGCNLSSTLPTLSGMYTSAKVGRDGSYLCFCDASDNLLLAMDTNQTGAVVPIGGVSLKIGTTPTTSWTNAGGMVSNQYGGAMFNRQWEVVPTTQPSRQNETIRYFFTNAEYLAIKDTMTNHNEGAADYATVINSVRDLEMYKLNGGPLFGDPHASGSSGILLTNGTTPSTTDWVHGTHGTVDHSAEFKVSSFSGGGGGVGGGGFALPTELMDFRANLHSDKTVHLNWSTASEVNNSHFEIERSYDGVNFEFVGRKEGAGNSQTLQTYLALDANYNGTKSRIYYRLKQVDQNGTFTYSAIRKVELQKANVTQGMVASPNPSTGVIRLAWTNSADGAIQIKIHDIQGKEVFSQTAKATEGYQVKQLNLSRLNAGVYMIQVQSNQSTEQFKLILK